MRRLAPLIILFMILFFSACVPDDSPKPTTETKLNVGMGMNAKIIVLPTGERVLLITGSEGLATCCLLPSIPVEKK
jgi:hypothetical protein